METFMYIVGGIVVLWALAALSFWGLFGMASKIQDRKAKDAQQAADMLSQLKGNTDVFAELDEMFKRGK